MKTIQNTSNFILAVSIILVVFNSTGRAQESGRSISGFDSFNTNEKSANFTSDTIAYSHFLIGLQFDADSDYESAVEEFDSAIKHDANFAEAYDRRGIEYTKMIKYGKALKNFNKAIELKSNFTDAYSHRGIVYYCLGEFNNAIADYTKALDINPKYSKAYYNRGIVKFLIDDEDGGIEDISIASQMNNDEAVAYLKTLKSIN